MFRHFQGNDGVKQGFSVMKRFGGFILGDVVGLGKTVVGVLLIRHFLENAETLLYTELQRYCHSLQDSLARHCPVNLSM